MTPPTHPFTPSPNQLAIFNFIQSGRGSAIVAAVAGSGKTTTIVEALKYIPPTQTVLFLAFNKSIAEELKTRVPCNVAASTFHSLGFSALKRVPNFKGKDEARKVDLILRDTIFGQPYFNKKKYDLYANFIRRLVSFAKGAIGLGALERDLPELWLQIVESQEMYVEEEEGASIEEGIKLAQLTLAESIKSDALVDFDDMLYLPLLRSARFNLYDYIFVDEAQDTNAIQREILRRCGKPSTRFIFVGDESQAIYGFRGADADAMQLLQEQFKATTLPLDVCYRCASAIVREAQKYQSNRNSCEIKPSPTAEEGLVKTLTEYKAQQFVSGAVVQCRNTAPLVSFAFTLIRRGIGCRILGRDIAEGLIKLVEKHSGPQGDVAAISDVLDSLQQWFQRESAKLVEKEWFRQLETLQEKVECLETIGMNVGVSGTADQLIDRINSLFTATPQRGLLTLCTVHKSKGLEWPTVFILDAPKYMPSKWAKQPWQRTQEKNLQYVACTRAKSELYYINSNEWKD